MAQPTKNPLLSDRWDIYTRDVDKWTAKAYSETIQQFLQAGYGVGSFEQYLQGDFEKYVVLRHDIDFDPSLLAVLHEAEAENGVNSTTFFRVAAKGYNLLSAPVVDLLHELRAAGSEVGLHLDIGIESCWNTTLHKSAEIQKTVFDSVAPTPMRGFSLHQPTNNGGYEFADRLVAEWGLDYHAYDSHFFVDMKYLSDSGGRWREGHWSEKLGEFPKMQVLTHPLWHHNGIAQRSF